MFFSDRHEKKKDPDFSPEPVEETEKVQEDETKEDFFFKYNKAKLWFQLLLAATYISIW